MDACSIQFAMSLNFLSAGLSINLLLIFPLFPLSKMGSWGITRHCLELLESCLAVFLIRSASLCLKSSMRRIALLLSSHHQGSPNLKDLHIVVTSIFPSRYSYRLAYEAKNFGKTALAPNLHAFYI